MLSHNHDFSFSVHDHFAAGFGFCYQNVAAITNFLAVAIDAVPLD
jgi:hypothetical protein